MHLAACAIGDERAQGQESPPQPRKGRWDRMRATVAGDKTGHA
jgi:hypothetical protein